MKLYWGKKPLFYERLSLLRSHIIIVTRPGKRLNKLQNAYERERPMSGRRIVFRVVLR